MQLQIGFLLVVVLIAGCCYSVEIYLFPWVRSSLVRLQPMAEALDCHNGAEARNGEEAGKGRRRLQAVLLERYSGVVLLVSPMYSYIFASTQRCTLWLCSHTERLW